MMGHNICFKGVIGKIIPKLSLLPLLIWALNLDPKVTHLGPVSHKRYYCDCDVCGCDLILSGFTKTSPLAGSFENKGFLLRLFLVK